jgi:hypothetical protein
MSEASPPTANAKDVSRRSSMALSPGGAVPAGIVNGSCGDASARSMSPSIPTTPATEMPRPPLITSGSTSNLPSMRFRLMPGNSTGCDGGWNVTARPA